MVSLTGIQPATAATAGTLRAAGTGPRFAQVLRGQVSMTADHADPQAKEAAGQLVASTFILPVLARVREDPFRSELFHGGFGEDAFGAQLDTLLADRMVAGSRMALVDRIARGMTRPSAGKELDLHG